MTFFSLYHRNDYFIPPPSLTLHVSYSPLFPLHYQLPSGASVLVVGVRAVPPKKKCQARMQDAAIECKLLGTKPGNGLIGYWGSGSLLPVAKLGAYGSYCLHFYFRFASDAERKSSMRHWHHYHPGFRGYVTQRRKGIVSVL